MRRATRKKPSSAAARRHGMWSFVLGWFLASGCGAGGQYLVAVVFPDGESQQLTRRVEVFVLEGGGECAALESGDSQPGDSGYEIADQVSGEYPSGEGLRKLKVSGAEPVLFFARARQSNGGIILAGCTREPGEGAREVEIILQWTCRPESEIDDTCDGTDDDCDGTLDEDACPDDGMFCNGEEFCNAQSGCAHRGDPCQGQGLVCDEASDACLECLADGDCDDGMECTADDCDVQNGLCMHQPNDALCPDDGEFCNGAEYCNAQSGCAPQGDPCQDEGLVCDETSDACLECVTGEDCDDGIDCTADDCDVQNGLCTHQPNDALCPDDGEFCNGAEYCNAQSGCAHRGDPCSGHGSCSDGTCTCETGYAGAACDSCAAGYIGYPNCADDPCDPDPCNGHGSCSGGACTCDTGYAGAACDRCDTGYIGYPDCADDPCDPDPCNGHGTCSGGTCTCETGYAGAACDSCAAGYIGYPNCADDPCDPDPCNGHGMCSGGTCTCETGYAGAACDSCAAGYIGYPNCADDPCDPDPCNGHGTCSGGTCTCDTGYAGATCDQCDPAYTGYPNCDQCSTFGEYPDCFLPGAGFCDTSQCFLVPPTNLNNCYDNSVQMTCTAFPCNADGTPDFCGQDAQYQDNDRVFTCYDAGGTVQDPCDFTADPDEVVTDSLTGLMWQRTWATGLIWQGAIDYCNNLVYAGYDDWRLPNPLELVSIVDYGRFNPAIDTGVFPGTPSDFFWSSSSVAFNTGNAWHVGFGNGHVDGNGKSLRNVARCVRSEPSFTGSGGGERYYSQEPVAGEQVVYDAVTGLLWQKSYATGKTWQEALSYCEGLDYAGHDDWKLPDIKEITSLVNYSIYSPASDYPDMPSDWFWSSSSAIYADNARRAGFGNGQVDGNLKGLASNARCVRPGP